MASYAVGTTNAFDLLGDDADKPKKSAPKKKEEPKKKAVRDNSKPDNRGGQKRDNDNRRGGRAAATGRAGNNNKRPFDRRSGTGRGKEGKKDGHGKFNWGTDGDFDGNPDARRRPARKDDDATAKPADAADEKAPDDATPPEPEPKSYDEYLQSLKEKAVAGDDLKVRSANNDDSAFETCGVAKEDDDSLAALFDMKVDVKSNKKKNKRKAKKKVVSLDEFVAAKPQRSNNRNNARGADRNNNGRTNNRTNNRTNRNGFNMKDQDFPTLG